MKVVTLIDDHPVIYTEHTLEGFSARTPLGHHAILAADPDAQVSISTSPIRFGTVADAPKEAYANGAYSALQPATDFHTLSKVPTRWKDPPTTDCTTFPSRCGFTDLLAVFQEPRLDRSPAWVAAVNTKQRYVWFSLKDPEILPSTLFWMDYYGRHTPPWRGRKCCIGLEDVCSYLANGLAASVAPNKVNERGVPTSMELRPEAATPVRYIQAAVGTPEGFTRVASVRFEEGATIRVPIQWEYLYGADL